MKKFLLILLVVSFVLSSCARSTPKTPKAPIAVALRRDFRLPIVIRQGEQLVYELKITKFPLSATAGEITFEYLGAADQPKIEGLDFVPPVGRAFLHFKARAVSRGLLTRVFGISVNDRFEALVDPAGYRSQAIVKAVEENKKHSLQAGVFDYDKGEVRYTTKDLTKTDSPARENTLRLEDDLAELLPAFYLMRLQELREGALIRFPMVFDGERSDFEMTVGGHETLDAYIGNVKTIKVEPKIFGPGRLLKREGELTIWLTDDDKHVPVRAVAKVFGATVNVELIKRK
jgi:hypothetical protein